MKDGEQTLEKMSEVNSKLCRQAVFIYVGLLKQSFVGSLLLAERLLPKVKTNSISSLHIPLPDERGRAPSDPATVLTGIMWCVNYVQSTCLARVEMILCIQDELLCQIVMFSKRKMSEKRAALCLVDTGVCWYCGNYGLCVVLRVYRSLSLFISIQTCSWIGACYVFYLCIMYLLDICRVLCFHTRTRHVSSRTQ